MGKKKRRMTSQKFAKKFASKYAKLKEILAEAFTAPEKETEEIEEEKVVTKKTPKVVVKEVDESAIAGPKPKTRSRKNSGRKKSPDLKKKAVKRTTSKRKTANKK